MAEILKNIGIIKAGSLRSEEALLGKRSESAPAREMGIDAVFAA